MYHTQARKKRGAIELSIGTIVIIVLATSLLVLGLVLIKNIFSGATESVEVLNDKVISSMSGLFTEEGEDLIVKLGPDQTARIKPNSGDFGIAIAARTADGSSTDRERMQYRLELETDTNVENCVKLLDAPRVRNLFITPLNAFRGFDKFQGANAFALIELNIPKGTPVCSQKVFVNVKDTGAGNVEYGNFFKIEIQKEGIFS